MFNTSDSLLKNIFTCQQSPSNSECLLFFNWTPFYLELLSFLLNRQLHWIFNLFVLFFLFLLNNYLISFWRSFLVGILSNDLSFECMQQPTNQSIIQPPPQYLKDCVRTVLSFFFYWLFTYPKEGKKEGGGNNRVLMSFFFFQ